MEKLKPLDALFVDAEDVDKNTSMAIASIAVFEGPAPSQEELMALVAGRLPLLPRYRQKLRMVPFRLGRPVWVDDPDFDLSYHIRRTALPEPGGDQQVADLMARLMSQRLDRDHPLWEYWLVEGLARDRWALISKVHHCMVDGISGTDMYRVLLDFPAEAAEPDAKTPDAKTPDAKTPDAETPDAETPDAETPDAETQAEEPPSARSLIVQAAADIIRLPVLDALALSDLIANPDRAIRQGADVARAIARLSPSLLPAARSSLSGNIGRQRRYAWARTSLEDIKTIKREFGGTVNDVVLAAISAGFRALLVERGEEPEPHEVPSLVPVSVRAPGDEGRGGNQVSATVADLPVHICDPVERLDAVRTELDSLKESNEALIGESLIALGQYSLYPIVSWLVRLAFRLPQREIVTVTTNVPGPRQPLYWEGRRLEEIVPYVPIASTVRTGISIFSYAGQVTFGITGDYSANPDLDVLARGIEHGVSELLLAAERHAAMASEAARAAKAARAARAARAASRGRLKAAPRKAGKAGKAG